MHIRLLIILATIAIISGEAYSFNGKLGGIVMGGGMGIGPITKSMTGAGNEKNSVGLGINMLIGYAWDNRNVFSVGYNANHIWPGLSDGDTVMSIFISPVWYHYYGNSDMRVFSAVGVGRHGLFIHGVDGIRGFGFLLGIGYEFRKHMQLGVYYSGGMASSINDAESIYIDRANIILTLVAY